MVKEPKGNVTSNEMMKTNFLGVLTVCFQEGPLI
jgi:hypothetical protein